jgi:hypothetical protein
MNRLVRGSVLFAAAVTAWACGGLDTGDIDTTEALVADPAVVFVSNTDSQAVFVEALNALAQQLEGDFAITDVGAGLVAFIDEAYAPVTGREGNPTQVRVFVRGTDSSTFVSSSFTVSANGKSLVVPVNITPSILRIAFPNPTPVLGEPITLTAPPNVVFTSATTITAGDGVAAITGLSADSTQITFLLGPNVNLQVATITDIGVTYLPNNSYDVTTTGAVTTPTVTEFPATFAPAAPDVGDTVTMTLTGLFRALPEVTITFGTNEAIITGISTDSTQVSFLPPPGSTGAPTVNNVIVTGVPVPIELPTQGTLAVTGTTTYTGTNASGSAPTIYVPSVQGASTGFFDLGSWAGNCGGVPCQWYTFTVTTAGDYFVTSAWDNTSDLGFFILESDGTTVVDGFDAHGNGATAQPEEGTVTLPAGTYFLQVQNFAPFYPDPDPTWFRVDFTLE